MTIYISGPISKCAKLNEQAFRDAAEYIQRTLKVMTICPHDLYRPDSHCPCLVWCSAMVVDLDAMAKCDAVYFLAGWHLSTGARRELVEAVRLGLQLIFQ